MNVDFNTRLHFIKMIFQIAFLVTALHTAVSGCVYSSNESEKPSRCLEFVAIEKIENYHPTTMLESMDEHCRRNYENGKLFILGRKETLQLLRNLATESINLFSGVQIKRFTRNGKPMHTIVYGPNSIHERHMLNDMMKIAHYNSFANTKQENLICPMIKFDRKLAKLNFSLDSCFDIPKWNSFVCETTNIAKAEHEIPCSYDPLENICVLQRSAANEERKLCHCKTCDVASWSLWGLWSSDCGSVHRVRVKPKDGKSLEDCIKNLVHCCIEKEEKQLQPCSNEQHVALKRMKIKCENGGTPVLDSNNKTSCICSEEFTGRFCSERLTKTGQVNYFEKLSKRMGFLTRRRRQSEGEQKDCTGNSCLNNGVCVQVDDIFECHCGPDHGGSNCEYETHTCTTRHCFNGNKCIYKFGEEQCECPAGFRGVDCKLYLTRQKCNKRTCIKGKCTVINNNDPACECEEGYEGAFCLSDVNECTRNPCKNGGNCINTYGSYHCQCLHSYHGELCELEGIKSTEQGCSNNPCINGICSTTNTGFECQCYAGYTGLLCDTEIHFCKYNLCLNGGSCIPTAQSHKCECPPDYTGKKCEKKLALLTGMTGRNAPSTDYTIPIVILVVLVLCGFSLLGYFTYKERMSAGLPPLKTPEKKDAIINDTTDSGDTSSHNSGDRLRDFLMKAGWKPGDVTRTTSELKTKSSKRMLGKQSPLNQSIRAKLNRLRSPRTTPSPKPMRKIPSRSELKSDKEDIQGVQESFLTRTKRSLGRWSLTPKISMSKKSQTQNSKSISKSKSKSFKTGKSSKSRSPFNRI